MQNHYPLWKNILLILLLVFGFVYAVPNLFGEDPAVQISARGITELTKATEQLVKQVLTEQHRKYSSITRDDDSLLVRFSDTDDQLLARDEIKAALGDNYIVAVNLAPRTPSWLVALGAQPMKLGLDLRGGVHFLMAVDVDALTEARESGDMRSISDLLRSSRIRYTGMSQLRPSGVLIRFRDGSSLEKAYAKLSSHLPNYLFEQQDKAGKYELKATLTQAALTKIANYGIDQTMTILRKRINELGVSEALVQRQGRDQISVDLPGVQDTARAKDIIGKMATLRFQMVNVEHDVQSALAGDVPIGSHLYEAEGRHVLLKDRVILRGDSITYATATFGHDGRPTVNVRLGGGGENVFYKTTAANIGKAMAVVYIEDNPEQKIINGKSVTVMRKTEKVISVATIQSALANNFEITGLRNAKYAQNLALLLRSGALVAPVKIIQERTVGPSLGKGNIHKGVISVTVGLAIVVLFMLLYYRLFGAFANVAVLLNIVFIVAILSVLGATLTLPGIAGIVLTVGMAVDANVLINERIREELRNGMSAQASIIAGYERAFVTIVDANVTTLIVAIVLFALGSGSVKGFAVTLTIGLMTSMVTAITYTRALANWVYGSRKDVRKLSIGT